MNSMKPIISIIVPVYNVEPYLEKCLDSISAQTYTNIEVILVDDASTDRCGSICDAYASRDGRMQAVHFLANRGLSAARNEGGSRASGEYITFIDSDDSVKPDLLDMLYSNLTKKESDISICGIEGPGQKKAPASTYTSDEAVCCLARRTPFLWNVWGKLYRTEDVKKHPFDEHAVCCEDLLFFYQMLKGAERISYFPNPLYHYLYRPGSLINSGIDKRRCTVLSVLDRICADASVHFTKAVPGLRLLAMDTCVRLAMQAVEDGTKDAGLFTYLRRFRKKIRQHFAWEALVLCRDKKTKASILLLHVSATAFCGIAAVYKCVKRISYWTAGME